jgi:predicted GNAT family N-acyltransferase
MDIRRIDPTEHFEDGLSVRRAVFIDEQGVPEDREIDGRDAEATHFVAYDDGRPIGVARLREYTEGSSTNNAAKIERVAVLEECRGAGVGRKLMDAAEESALSAGYDTIVLHAQLPVVDFYTRLGYEPTGEPFEDAGIPHRKMSKSFR